MTFNRSNYQQGKIKGSATGNPTSVISYSKNVLITLSAFISVLLLLYTFKPSAFHKLLLLISKSTLKMFSLIDRRESTLELNTFSNKYIICYVSFPSADTAKHFARNFVQKKIVACAKIINNVESIYNWEGKIEEAKEAYLMLKTNKDSIEKIKEILDNEHPYKVYEFLYFPMQVGNNKYAEWMQENLS